MKRLVLLFSCVVCMLLLSSCFGNSHTVDDNRVFTDTIISETNFKQRLIIKLDDDRNYGSFALLTTGYDPVMMLEFTGINYNDGRVVTFSAEPRTGLVANEEPLTNGQADYSVRITLNEAMQQYEVELHDVPPSFAETYAGKTISMPMQLSNEKINAYFKDLKRQEQKRLAGTGAAAYFGSWMYYVKNYLFWIYAILFGILALTRNDGSIWRHLILTAILYWTFYWDFAPARAFVIPYYIYMPLLYLPFIKNSIINSIIIFGTIAAMIWIGYNDWLYEGLFSWIIDIAGWGLMAVICLVIAVSETDKRCPHCGHFALSWYGNTPRYLNAVEHFRYLNADGSDNSNMTNGELKSNNAKIMRCGHCMMTNEKK